MRPPLAGDFALPEDRGCVRGLGAVRGDALGVARATHLLSRDEARRIVNIAKLPELLRPI